MSKKQEPTVKKNAFVQKLYYMLNEPSLSHLIWWTRDEDSNTFALSPGKEFAQALTGYFKHGNVASFVRQLHMYGFHKVLDTNSNSGTGLDKQQPIWEFRHSSGKFRKNDESSLIHIKRRSSSNSSRNNYNNDVESIAPTSSQQMPQLHYVPDHNQYAQTYISGGQYFSQPVAVRPQRVNIYSYPSVAATSLEGEPPAFSDLTYPVYPYTPSGIQPTPSRNFIDKSDMLKKTQDSSRPISPVAVKNPPNSQASKDHNLTYKPGLEFRKIWENTESYLRPRNPSLLYDPLAPAPIPTPLPSLSVSQKIKDDQALQNHPYMIPRTETGSVSSTRDSMVSSKDIERTAPLSLRNSYFQRNPSHVIDSEKGEFSSTSRFTKGYGVSSVHSSSLPAVKTFEPTTHINRPSLLHSNSFQDKIRHSLIELHYGQGTRQGILQHSIASQSSHNSVFSAKSSLSSDSSLYRTSIGSISQHPFTSNKSSFCNPSIPSDHATTSESPKSIITVEQDSKGEPEENRSVTPPPTSKMLLLNPIRKSPGKRKLSALGYSHGLLQPLKIRSLTISPLSNVMGCDLASTDDLTSVEEESTKLNKNSKASVAFLLDNKTSAPEKEIYKH